MPMTWTEALAALAAPGAPFESVESEVLGRRQRVFKNAPPTLRALFDLARTRGDAAFLVYEDERWSFAETMRQVDALGAALVRLGVAPGDRVAIAMRNYPEWVVAFAAITSIGAISVSMNAWWTSEEMEYALRDSGSRVVIADAERLERIAPLLGALELLPVVVRAPGALPPGAKHWRDVVVPGDALPAVAVDPDMDATILYTSGTTGHPKGAVSTHRAVTSALFAFAFRSFVNNAMGIGGPKREQSYPTSFVLVVPLFHVTGCVAVMLSCFLAGYKVVMMHKWDAKRALELIERERITNFVGVPTQSWDLLECPDFAKYDTSSLASVGGGGAPAPPELVRRVYKGFAAARPGIGYGMTETNAYGPGNSGPDYLRKPTSCGRVVPPVELRVTDEGGRVLGPNEVGELWFRGPTLIRGYWNKPAATAETIVDGWLRTGDIGRIDEEGFVYVQDRAKDMVLRAGENVYCAEVEAALYEHPDVYEAAVFGVPHERLGEEVAAAIVPKPGRTLEPEALRTFLAKHLAGFKIPTRIALRGEALPRNPAGKILKRSLRDQLAGSA
jgi:long-chain acyl-CoA synthetase